mmetsp:Transcript_116656/g.371107  ORF Transcript_116656/g.371107 Transcript_116656/m.371107 type:complete len:247 (-) Transcript_116656:609-1349(-)
MAGRGRGSHPSAGVFASHGGPRAAWRGARHLQQGPRVPATKSGAPPRKRDPGPIAAARPHPGHRARRTLGRAPAQAPQREAACVEGPTGRTSHTDSRASRRAMPAPRCAPLAAGRAAIKPWSSRLREGRRRHGTGPRAPASPAPHPRTRRRRPRRPRGPTPSTSSAHLGQAGNAEARHLLEPSPPWRTTTKTSGRSRQHHHHRWGPRRVAEAHGAGSGAPSAARTKRRASCHWAMPHARPQASRRR